MRLRWSAAALVALTATMVVVVAQSASSASGSGVTSRVSVASDGRQAIPNGYLYAQPAISADGRFVAFASSASNLVAGDTNGVPDVFVRDRLAGVTRRVSVGASGQANHFSADPAISADGRFVAFESGASNLVAGDTNGKSDVFVRDRLAGVTRRVSVGVGGQANYTSNIPAISADGRFVAFDSGASNLVAGDTNGTDDVFVWDRLAGVTRRVSVGGSGQANNGSYSPAVSADGRFVAFESFASNLVAGDTNGKADVFVRDRLAGVTRRVSVGAGGQANSDSGTPTISADGRFVAFLSGASNLVPGDTNGTYDVFVRDRLAGVTRQMSVGAGGQANDYSAFPAISANGRSVAYESYASNLVRGDTNGALDVFVRDPLLGPAPSAGRP